MIIRDQLFVFLLSFLLVGFLFLLLPEKSYSGNGPLPGGTCCQFETDECSDFDDDGGEGPIQACRVDDLRPGTCNEETGLCEVSKTAIPTLNEWGLITIALALGTVGIVVYRRRRVSV